MCLDIMEMALLRTLPQMELDGSSDDSSNGDESDFSDGSGDEVDGSESDGYTTAVRIAKGILAATRE
ncbi:MAG: hypothetical protein ACLRMZ_27420 [Blautia marasmi]